MNNRNMFYQNVSQGYSNPGTFIPPSGYNLNAEYQAYGPNTIQNNTNYYDDTENRISKLERQVMNLNTRLSKLENINNEVTDTFNII